MRILLIDGSNLYKAAEGLGLVIDFKKLHAFFSEGQDKFRAYYFTALPPRSEINPMQKLVDWLGCNGYCAVTKEYKSYTNSDGSTRTKGNLDVEIAIYGLKLAKLADEIFLFSGDGDYTPLVAEMQLQSNVKVICVSSEAILSQSLKRQCDAFIPLEKLAQHIRY